jgi:hypothetical protein
VAATTGSGDGGGTRGWLALGFEGDWHGDVWGRCTQAYIGLWEESRRIKVRIRDKIQL